MFSWGFPRMSCRRLSVRLVYLWLQTWLVNKDSSHMRQPRGLVLWARCVQPLGLWQFLWLLIQRWKFLGRRWIYQNLVYISKACRCRKIFAAELSDAFNQLEAPELASPRLHSKNEDEGPETLKKGPRSAMRFLCIDR